jgi:hypothetical protein
MSGLARLAPAPIGAASRRGESIMARCGRTVTLLPLVHPDPSDPAGLSGSYASEARVPGIWFRWLALAAQCPMSSSAAADDDPNIQ